MKRIRVLVVDDSVVIRKVLCDALSSDSELEIAGIAPDGRIALARIPQLDPDIVTLDVEMPNLSGLETVVEIRKIRPKLPVIMFSTLTERGASITLEALSLGASDYVTKPSNTGSLDITVAKIREELVPKIKALCARASVPRAAQFVQTRGKQPAAASRTNSFTPRVDVVAIGTSTGGPNALAEVLPLIAKDFPVPIVVVQHMPPLFTRLLAERLNKTSAIKISEGEAGGILEAGHAWIAPGNYHMTVEARGNNILLAMNQDPPENSCRPAADVLFRSVAKIYGANVLGVVLTGMGSDALRGCQAIRAKGGRIFAQDEASSVVWGMPGSVVQDGSADKVLPLSAVAFEIDRYVRNTRQPSGAMTNASIEKRFA